MKDEKAYENEHMVPDAIFPYSGVEWTFQIDARQFYHQITPRDFNTRRTSNRE